MTNEIMQGLLNESLEHGQNLSFHSNVNLKTPENFEVRYEQALEYLKSGSKADLANYRKAVNDLIKEGGLIPILIYNAGKYKGFENIDQPEERKTFYDNWDKMVDEYNKTRNDKKTYTDQIQIDGKSTNYNTWKNRSAANLKGLSEEQKKAIFAANFFMSEHTTNVKNQHPAFYQGIVDPSLEKGIGDCNTSSILYAGLLIQAQDKGSNLFPNDELNFKFYMDPQQKFPSHVRVAVKNTFIEATHHYIATLGSDNVVPLKSLQPVIADIEHMVPVMLLDEENSGKKVEKGSDYIVAGRISAAFNDDKITLSRTYHINACQAEIQHHINKAWKESDVEQRNSDLFMAYKLAMESGYDPIKEQVTDSIQGRFKNIDFLKARYEAEIQEQARIEAERQKTPAKQRN